MIRICRKYLFVALFIQLGGHGWAQSNADELFEKGNYDEAYTAYANLGNENLSTLQLYRKAVALLNASLYDKLEAIPVLQKYLQQKSTDGNAHYLLGRAYASAHLFTQAEQEFMTCLTAANILPENKLDAGHQIDMCQNARALMPLQTNVELTCLSSNVNGAFKDYFPFIDVTESSLYYNTRRNDGSSLQENGEFTSAIYFAEVKNGEFVKAEPVKGKLNTLDGNEEIVGLSQDGKKAIVSFEDKHGNIDLKIAKLEKGKFMGFEKLPKSVNTIYQEIAATFGSTTNEIYFASNRPGGYGGIDLYVVRKKQDGKWGEPQNLGPEINTRYDEDFPNISLDGQYLFFSSKGHSSIGGYDIFKATWNDEVKRYVKPLNVGMPVNTVYDDMNLIFSRNGRYGYMARLSEKNGYDIYRVTFNDVEQEITVVTGVLELDKQIEQLLSGIIMVVEDNKTGNIVGEYLPNASTLRYVMALAPGEYTVTIEVDGYEPVQQKLTIYGMGSYQPELVKNYKLEKK